MEQEGTSKTGVAGYVKLRVGVLSIWRYSLGNTLVTVYLPAYTMLLLVSIYSLSSLVLSTLKPRAISLFTKLAQASLLCLWLLRSLRE
jgi:hypothetical protein